MSFLTPIRACNQWDPTHFQPFFVDGERVGWLRHAFADRLRHCPDVFRTGPKGVLLAPALTGFEQRSQAVARVLAQLAEEGVLSHLHGEPYPVTATGLGGTKLVLDRAAATYFGIRAFGQHINGFVRQGGRVLLWVGRRAADRRHFPLHLDNLVAGGLPHGVGLDENLEKECWEEAGIPGELVRSAVPVGAVTYCRETDCGLKPDTLFCYDLELPADFVPHCTDGEVESFYLWPVEKVMGLVSDSDEFKLNCNLVIIDFLIRHGILGPDHEDFLELVWGLHPRLP